MTDTQERFLRDILTRVALDDVVELHLFPAIRRGTLETGVAVLAMVPPPPAPVLVVDAEPVDEVVEGDAELEAGADAGDEVDEAAEAEPAGDIEAEHDATIGDDTGETVEAIDPVDIAPVVASPRTLILTASYRHTIKGPDRDKWLVDVQAEADAPLDAVEAVLRGVRHRSSEPADPERVTYDTLAALVAPTIVAPAA